MECLNEVVIKNRMLMSFAESKQIKVWSLADRQLTYTIEDKGLHKWIFGRDGTTTENKLLVFANETQHRGYVTYCRIYNLETGVKERQFEYSFSAMSVLAVDNTYNFVVAWYREKLCFISLTTYAIAKEIVLNDVLKSTSYTKATIKKAVFNARNDHMIISSNNGDIICLKL